MVKYDGTQRGKIGQVVKKWEKRGFKLAGFKMVTPPIEHWK
jgi:nucleoside diphosphate kinase